ncbi:Sybindin-like family-domain-containing protein [Scheffersomyces xylosifermentans]|uniref:Sybindin-like family-domain-containing protein n=1 Tax=Scheffersomyces xylosifermentans TaxID=1304137 RepID=UPI00315D2D83
MAIYSFFIFDRHCNCIYNREFTHLDHTNGTSVGQVNRNNDSNTSKLLFGILYSLKTISSKLIDSEESESIISNALKSFTIGNYRIHYLESLTRLKFVLVSDNDIDNLQTVLWELYSNYFIRNVVQNSLSPVEFKQSDDIKENETSGKINNSNFINETDDFLQSLPFF